MCQKLSLVFWRLHCALGFVAWNIITVIKVFLLGEIGLSKQHKPPFLYIEQPIGNTKNWDKFLLAQNKTYFSADSRKQPRHACAYNSTFLIHVHSRTINQNYRHMNLPRILTCVIFLHTSTTTKILPIGCLSTLIVFHSNI